MNNDLISREALKADFNSRLSICNGWIVNAKDKETKIRARAVKAFIAEVLMTIDNAPSVDIKDQIAGAYNEGFMCGNREAEKARPQGEWIIDDWSKIIECNKCRGQAPIDITSGEQYRSNFCPICGAKMKGVTEKAKPQAFINGIVEIISKNGITTVDELLELLKGGTE